MARVSLESYDGKDNHALSHMCRVAGWKPPPGTPKHKLITFLARLNIKAQEQYHASKSRDYDANNDPTGSSREALIKENRKVLQHWTCVDLQATIQFNRENAESFKNAQVTYEGLLEKKLEQFTITEGLLLEKHSKQVQDEQASLAAEKSNDARSNSAKMNDLFEGSEPETEDPIETPENILDTQGCENETDREETVADEHNEVSEEKDDGLEQKSDVAAKDIGAADAEKSSETTAGGDYAADEEIPQYEVGEYKEDDEEYEEEENTTTPSKKRSRSTSFSDLDETRPPRKVRFVEESSSDDALHPCLIEAGPLLAKLLQHDAKFLQLTLHHRAAKSFLREDIMTHAVEIQGEMGEAWEYTAILADKSAMFILFSNTKKGQEHMKQCASFIAATMCGNESHKIRKEITALRPHSGKTGEDAECGELDLLEIFKGEKVCCFSREDENFLITSAADTMENSDEADEVVGDDKPVEDGSTEEGEGEVDTGPASLPAPSSPAIADESEESEEE